MTNPLVVVFPRGQLAPKDKERMTKAGIVAVEAETPQDVCQLHLSQPFVNTQINGDALVAAALQALASQSPETAGGSITSSGKASHKFIQLLAASLEKKAS